MVRSRSSRRFQSNGLLRTTVCRDPILFTGTTSLAWQNRFERVLNSTSFSSIRATYGTPQNSLSFSVNSSSEIGVFFTHEYRPRGSTSPKPVRSSPPGWSLSHDMKPWKEAAGLPENPFSPRLPFPSPSTASLAEVPTVNLDG